MKLIFLLFAFPAIVLGQTTISWDTPVSVAESSFSNLHPRIVLDRLGNPLVLWGNTTEAAAYFARWNGTEFTEPVRVTPIDMEIFTASWAGPDIATHGDTIYVVCKENPEDMAPAYCIHSYDGGMTFSDPVVVDGMIGDNISRFPSVTVNEDGQPIVAFMKLDSDFGNARYVVAKSDDFGNSFNMDVLASDFSGGDVCDCCPVSVTSENNYVATLYRDNLDNLRNSWAGISTNGGEMFMNGIQIDHTDWTINACPSTGPDGVIIGDSLYSVYMSAASGEERVYFSAASLTTFEANFDERISPEILELDIENYPRIAKYENTVAVVWKDVILDAGIKLQFTDNIQNRFPDYVPIVVTEFDPDYNPINADVAVSSTDVHVVWQEGTTGTVMYRKGIYSEPVLVNDKEIIKSIHLYPNPSGDQIYIDLHYFINGNIDLAFFDVSGNQVFNKSYCNSEKVNVDISNLSDGIYLLKIIDSGGETFTQKVSVIK